MPLVREIRKALGGFLTDPRDQEKLEKLEKKVEFLYKYMQLNEGERQYSSTYSDIRPDHLGRYRFAASKIMEGSTVVDAACGIGYGSCLISEESSALVTGIDISEEAIRVAKNVWDNENTSFIQADCTNTGITPTSFDWAVSFETIEHIPMDEALLQHLHSLLKTNGRLICSTPNEDFVPYDKSKYPYHVKHYTESEISNLVSSCGFKVDGVFCQKDKNSELVESGADGSIIVLLATKI